MSAGRSRQAQRIQRTTHRGISVQDGNTSVQEPFHLTLGVVRQGYAVAKALDDINAKILRGCARHVPMCMRRMQQGREWAQCGGMWLTGSLRL